MAQSDVLVVGAGPSGLFAAGELARHSVGVRLIEKDVRPHRQARATAIEPGTLEILDSVGLLPAFLEASVHVRCTRLYSADLSDLRAATFEGIDCRCEFLCSLPQYETQRILEDHLKSLGGAVERGVTVTKLELDGNGVLVELVHADGTVETVHPRVVIGAGGAHSITRDSMDERLEGDTYQGHFLVADIVMQAPFPRDETSFVFGPDGLLLLAPLSGGRWLTFQDLDESVETVSAEDVVARVAARLGGRWRPTDVAWISPFRMHRRIVSRLADARRFLIGDAAHLSSPFGGEGLNSGLHDGYDLAWKLALVLRGHGRHSLLDDYAGSPLVADHGQSGADMVEPHPGQRYPDWTRFGDTSHHVLVFGPVTDGEGLAGLGRRWAKCVEISHNPDVNPARAGVGSGGMVLIRPDGHIGFRIRSADVGAIAALDRHLSSYLIPDPTADPV
jgi:2-polyprenyl-6-methoxyphenol hydroxylase-like FAD-dependent oxidoreductase